MILSERLLLAGERLSCNKPGSAHNQQPKHRAICAFLALSKNFIEPLIQQTNNVTMLEKQQKAY